MNNIELILENIRLKHIEHLLQETSDNREINFGIALINESMQNLYMLLKEDGWAGFSNDSTWADESKSTRVKNKTGQVMDSTTETPVEKIPGEAPIQKQTGPILQNIASKRKIGLGMSKRY